MAAAVFCTITRPFLSSALVSAKASFESESKKSFLARMYSAKAFALTCTVITSSRAWKLIMPPAKVRQRKEKQQVQLDLLFFLSLRMEN